MSRSRRRSPSPPRPVPQRLIVAVVLLFGAPAVVVPGALNRFVFGKLAVAAAATALAALCRPTGRLRREAVALLGAGACVLVLSALLSTEPLAGILGRAPRYEGVFVLATYLAVGWAAARLLGPERDDRVVRVALRTLAVAVTLIALFAILEACGLRPLASSVDRPGSLLGNASDEGVVGVLCLGPLALEALRRHDRYLGAAAVLSLLVVVLSASRAALAASVVVVLLLGIVLGGRRAVIGTLAALVLVTGVSMAIPSTRDRVLGTSALSHHTVTGRELLWRESLRLDAHHLALGVGPSNFKTMIVSEHSRRWQAQVGPQDPPDSPHSIPLQVLSAGGVSLLGLALGLVFLAGSAGLRAARKPRPPDAAFVMGAAIGLSGYLVACLAGFTSPGPTLLAASFGGVLLSAAPRATARVRLPLAGCGFGALAVVLVLAGVAEIPLRHAILAVARGDNVAADRDFSVARDLRFWDVDLPGIAAHAYVTQGLADGDTAAINVAGEWLRHVPSELRNDEQIELDTASFDEAQGRYDAAAVVLTRVLAVDRYNPAVLLQRGVVEAEGGQLAAAERDFRATSAIVPNEPGPWTNLAVLYREEHRTAASEAAQARAEHLTARRIR